MQIYGLVVLVAHVGLLCVGRLERGVVDTVLTVQRSGRARGVHGRRDVRVRGLQRWARWSGGVSEQREHNAV